VFSEPSGFHHTNLAVAVQRGAVQRRAAGRVLGVLQAAEGQVLGVGQPTDPKIWFPKNGMNGFVWK